MYRERFDWTKPFIVITVGGEYIVNPLAEEIRDVHVSSGGTDSGYPTNTLVGDYSIVPPYGHALFHKGGGYEDVVVSWAADYETASDGKQRCYFVAGKDLRGCPIVRYIPYMGGGGWIVPRPEDFRDKRSVEECWIEAFASLPESQRTAALVAEEGMRKDDRFASPYHVGRIWGKPFKIERTRIGFTDGSGAIWGVVSLGTDGKRTAELLAEHYRTAEVAAALVLRPEILELCADVRRVYRSFGGQVPHLYRSSADLFADHDSLTREAFLWDGKQWASSDDPADWKDELGRPLDHDKYLRRSSLGVEILVRSKRDNASNKRWQRTSLKDQEEKKG